MKTVRASCLARSALLGNPSDGFGGATISLTLANWRAVATVRPADGLALRMGQARREWANLAALGKETGTQGHPPPLRLLTATLQRWLAWHGVPADDPALRISLEADSDIPLQVGLGGSSAIVIAAFRALDQWRGPATAPELLASLALTVETETLGIPAGLQDRVCQSLEGLVAMDFSPGQSRMIHGLRVGRYERLDEQLLPGNLFVAWNPAGSEGTEVPHRSLRERFDAGESAVHNAMREFAEIARRGIAALRERNHRELARLIDANFDLRQSISELNPVHVAMIRAARAAGACAQYSGSGGAIVGIAPEEARWEDFAQSMRATGCSLIRPDVSGRAVREPSS